MRCRACNAVNPRSSSHCDSCGVALTTACRRCGHDNHLTAQFCSACGDVLDSALQGHALGGAASQTPWGERKQGTVLFADVVGSTQLIADLDPEQAMDRLHPSLNLMSAAVRRFGGTVIRTLGDGIMAAFGVPRAQEAHALLACHAAIAIQRGFEHYKGDIKVRIGLHSGELVVSEDEDREPVPHGATIHLARRLEEMADPGTICLTSDCYERVKLHCDVRFLGERDAKGFSRPVETYVLLGLKPAVASQQFRAVSLTPFYGREHEFDRLKRALQCTENGDTRVVGISGIAGAGKSRLCYEFAEWCRRRFLPVLEARALVSGEATPLQPILEFLRLLLDVSSSEDEATACSRIAQHPAVVGLDGETDIPLLCQFLGINRPGVEVPSWGSRARQARLRQVVAHMVKQRGAQPFVVIIEDLHWMDAGSAEFIGEIVRAVAGTRTMVVVNFRQPYAAEWMRERYYEKITLVELGPSQTKALVDGVVGGHPELRSVKERIVARCGGNPFFAEQLVRSLSERGVFRGEVGDYRLGPRSDEEFLPASVQEIVGERIDALPPPEKAVIHIAAIVGKEFRLSVIKDVANIPSRNLQEVVDRLHQSHLIEPEFGTVGEEYFFTHPLLQEVAYNEQLKSRRSKLHAAVAVVLERQYASKLDEFAALISHHYEAAGDLGQAAIYAARAAVWIGSAASSQAFQHWHEVRRLVRDQPHSFVYDTLRMRASGQIAMFGWREGLTAEEARPFIDEALGWARKIDDSMTSLLLAADGRIAVASGHPADDYVARIEEALRLEGERANTGRIATLNALLCHANLLAGFLRAALEANNQALQGVADVVAFDEQFLGLNVEQWMQSLRGRILVRSGRFEEAEKCLQQVLTTEESLLDPAVQFIPHLAYVDLAYFLGDPVKANEHAARIAQIAEKGRNRYLEAYALGCLGVAKLVDGDFAGGVRALTEAIGFAQSAKAALESEPEMMTSLADCHYQLGNFDEARSVAKRAIELAQRRSARLAECRALVIFSSALLAARRREGLAEALSGFDRAEELIRMTGADVFLERLAKERARTSIDWRFQTVQ